MLFKSVNVMSKSCINVFLIPILMNCLPRVLCSNTEKCYFTSKTSLGEEKLLHRISPIIGQIFSLKTNNYSYSVGFCVDAIKSQANVSAEIIISSTDTRIIGLRNETEISAGATWLLLKYNGPGCNVHKEIECHEKYSASIFIVCDPVNHDQMILKLVELNRCHASFVLPTSLICEHDQKVSGSTVFFIIFCVIFFMYFVVGIIYKKLVRNAQGCQQLPHFSFWQKIGALCSDGCNYICRCDSEPEDSWNNIANNFDNGDRDDALLKP